MPAAVGSPAPEFELRNRDRNRMSSTDLMGKKSTIVFMPYPFTRTCDSELCDLRDNLNRFNAMDTNVIVITCDTVASNAKWAELEGFQFPILSDFWPHGEVARAYGCFNDRLGVAMRSTFVLDEDGIIRDIISTDTIAEARPLDAYWESLAAID